MSTQTEPVAPRHFEAISGTVDTEDGIIKGVSVMTEGVVRGWNMLVDSTTLKQMLKLAKEFSTGVKVKADHWGGLNTMIGSLRNFRIKGKKLLADFQIAKTLLSRGQKMGQTHSIGTCYAAKTPQPQRQTLVSGCRHGPDGFRLIYRCLLR